MKTTINKLKSLAAKSLVALAFTFGLANAAVADHTHDDVTFTTPIGTLAQLTSLFSNGGSGYLTADIQLSSTLSVTSGKTVNLCLNGFVITAPLTSTKAINYTTGNGLFLANCQSTEHKFTPDYSGRWVRDEANGTNTIAGGCIVGANDVTIYASAANLKLSGINIVGGLGGSALEAHDAVVTVDNCGFYGSLAGYGGAIYLVGAAGQSSFKDCVFKGNKSTRTDSWGGGGAVYVKSYSVNTACFERCVFEGNSSYFHGGAIYDYNSSGNSTLVLTNCTLRGNFSQNYGGAVYAPNNMICSGCLIERNYGSYAGGVYCSKILTMEDSVVQYNTCNARGGGLYLNSWGSDPLMTCTIKSSVIRGNRTSDDDNNGFGGGITVGSQRILDLYDVIIEDNYAARCGAIAAWNTVNQYGGIIRRNFGGVYGAVGAPTNFLTYNLIDGQIVDNCTGIKPYGDQNGGGGVGSATTLNVGGTAYIYGNTNTLGQADDVVVNPNIGFIAGHPLTDGAKIGLGFFNALSYGGSQIRTAANDESVLKYFRANKSNYIVYEDASHAVGLKYPAATSIGSQAQLTTAINALTPGCTAVWNISADFTVTETAAIKVNGFNLTINGNGRTITATQAGTELASVFNVESQGTSAALLSVKDLNLAVGDGFRTGFNVTTASGDETARTQVECENVNITMVHTAAPVGGDAVALVNADAAVTMTRNSKITVNSFSRAAVDLTASAKDTVLSIESTSVGFADVRPVAKVNTDPLIKLTDNSSGAKQVTVDGVANTSLFWVDLVNGSGYNDKLYIPAVVPSVQYATAKVYSDGAEIAGPDYMVVSNASTYVVYTAPADHVFTNGAEVVTNFFDTAKNPATVIGALPEVSRILEQPSADNGYTFVVDGTDCTVTYQWYTNGASSRALTAADLGAIGGTLDFANGTYASANNGYIYGTYACLSNQLIAAGGVITFKCNIDIDLYTQNDDGTLTKAADGTYTYVAKDNSGEYNLWVYGNDEFTLTNLATPAAGAVAIAGETNPKLSFLRDKTESFCTASFTPDDPLHAPFAITSDTVSRELIIAQPTSLNDFTFSVITDDYPGTVAYQWYKRELKMRPITVDDIEDISCGTFNDDGSFTSGNDGLEKIYFTLKADVFDPDYKVTFKTTDSAVEYYNNAGLTGEEANQYYYEVNKWLYFSAYKFNDATPYTLTDFKVPYWAVTPIAGETAAQLSLAKQVMGETYQCKATYTRTGAAETDFVLTSEAATRYHAHDGVEFKTAIGTEEELRNLCSANGTGYLTADITITDDDGLTVLFGVTNSLCLNGFAIKGEGVAVTNFTINVAQKASLAIYDCDETTPHYFAVEPKEGRWIPTNTVTDCVTYGGYICGLVCRGIYVNESATLKLRNVTLVGNSADAIYTYRSKPLMVDGCDIVGNTDYCYHYYEDKLYRGTDDSIIELSYTDACFTNCTIHANKPIDRSVFEAYGTSSQPANLEIVDSYFCNNESMIAGAIYAYYAQVVLSGQTVVSNNTSLLIGSIFIEEANLVIRDQVRIVENGGQRAGSIVILGGKATLEGTPYIADNPFADMAVVSYQGINVTELDLSGLKPGAFVRFTGVDAQSEISYSIMPVTAADSILLTTNVTADVLSMLSVTYTDQYLEFVSAGEDRGLWLRARLIEQPSAANEFTYDLDEKHYTGAPDEGTVAYQWYPSKMISAEVTDQSPDRPTSLAGYYNEFAQYDAATHTWSGEANMDKGDVVIVGFNAIVGTDVTFAMKKGIGVCGDDYVIGLYAEDLSTMSLLNPIDEQGDWLFFKTTAEAPRLLLFCEYDDDVTDVMDVVVSNLVTTTQVIDYEHPIAGQTNPAYDFSASPENEGTFANVASFIDADGVTTNFTMKSGIIGFHVNRDKDGNVIACFDQPINTQSALVALFQNGGAGYLTADFKLSDAGDEFEIPEGVVVDLCMNGHVLDLNDGFISNHGTLRIVDCLDHATLHYFAVGEDMRWVLTNDVTAAKCVKGGVIYNGYHDDADEDNPGAVSSVYSSTTIVSRVNFIGNGSAMLVGAYKDDAEWEPTKTVVEDCFFAGNTIGGLGTVVVVNGTNHVFRNCVITENLGLACGGIGSIMAPSFVMIDMVVTNNYAAGIDFGGGALGFGGAALLSYYPVLGGKIIIKDNYVLTDGGAVLSNAGFIEGEMAPGVFLGSATLLSSFSADSEIGVTTANAVLGEIQPYPFILALTNDTDFASCFFPDDGVSIISYNGLGQVQLITGAIVSFDTHGGSEIASTNTFIGLTLVKPADPVRFGFEFLSWYADAECTQEWDFDNDVVPYANFTLHAGWLELRKVVYDAAGGAFEADGLDVRVDFQPPASPKYDFPEDPVRTNFTFLGWYDGVTPAANKLVNGTSVSPAVTNVFAKWQSNAVTPGTSTGAGGDTADGLAVTNFRPTVAIADGNVVIPDTIDNTPTGKAILTIGRSAYTPAQYEKKLPAPAIKSVTIPAFVTEIGQRAFMGNACLSNVVFSPVIDYKTGEKTTLYVKNYAFSDCAITNVVFPAGGSYKLGYLAFANNPQLKDVYIYGDVSLESLDKQPFREVGEEVGGTVFHLSPSAFTNKVLVAALTNGLHMVQVREADPVSSVSDTPIGAVEVGQFTVDTEITVEFTLPANSPWTILTTDVVSLLYSNDPTKLIVGDCTKIQAKSLELIDVGQYRAKFDKPSGANGFFTVCIGD